MTTFKRFLLENPDNIFLALDQVTFFYLRRADDLLSVSTPVSEKVAPGFGNALGAAASRMRFPCLASTVAGDPDYIALVPMSSAVTTVKNSAGMGHRRLNTHAKLLGTLLYELVGGAVRDGKSTVTGRQAIDAISAAFTDDFEERDVGVSGRMTKNYFTTWLPMEHDLCLEVMDAFERAKVIGFKDVVTVDCGDLMSADLDPMRVERRESGRFSA